MMKKLQILLVAVGMVVGSGVALAGNSKEDCQAALENGAKLRGMAGRKAFPKRMKHCMNKWTAEQVTCVKDAKAKEDLGKCKGTGEETAPKEEAKE